MPLGNLTSQFFANVYLNKLDYFVKHELKARFYIRYVDDFVIFEVDEKKLEFYMEEINIFLKLNRQFCIEHTTITAIGILCKSIQGKAIHTFA